MKLANLQIILYTLVLIFIGTTIVTFIGWIVAFSKVDCDALHNCRGIRKFKETNCTIIEKHMYEDLYIFLSVDIPELEKTHRLGRYNHYDYSTDSILEDEYKQIAIDQSTTCWISIARKTIEYNKDDGRDIKFMWRNHNRLIYMKYSTDIEDDKVTTHTVWAVLFLFNGSLCVLALVGLVTFICVYGDQYKK